MTNTTALLEQDRRDTNGVRHTPTLKPLNMEVADLQPTIDEAKAFINRRAVREFREWRQTKLERGDVMDLVVEGIEDDIEVGDALRDSVSPCLRPFVDDYVRENIANRWCDGCGRNTSLCECAIPGGRDDAETGGAA